MNILRKYKQTIIKTILFFSPFLIILYFSRNILLNLPDPSWGDMVSIPTSPIPLTNLFNPWQDIYSGSFGGQYIPHFLLSQFVRFTSPTVLQYFYLFILFGILFVCFLDFLKIAYKSESFFDKRNLIIADLLIMLIFFSNVFLVNFIQGNPDVYYSYLLAIPTILYSYLFLVNKDILSALKISLIITIATWFGLFTIYYQAFLLLPFIILFSLLFIKDSYRKLFIPLLLLVLLVFVNNLPYIFMTIKPILSAIANVSGSGSNGALSVGEVFSLYEGFNFLNLFYFSGNYGDITWILFNIPGGSVYVKNMFYSLLPFQLIVLISMIIYFPSKKTLKKQTTIILGLLGIFLLFMFIITIWDTSIFVSIAKYIPLSALYRNPKKMVLSLYVAFIILVIFIGIFMKMKIRWYILSLLLLVIINLLSVYPLISDGYAGLLNAYIARAEFYKLHSSDVKNELNQTLRFPSRFLKLKSELQILDEMDGKYHYRIVVLPDNTQTLYQSSLRYIFNPFFVNPTLAVWGNLDPSFNLMNHLYNQISRENIDLSGILKIANIKYLIIDRRSPYYLYTSEKKPATREYYGTFTTGDPERYYQVLTTKPDLSLVFSNSDFYIFKNDNFSETSLYTPSKICTLDAAKKLATKCDYFQKEDTNQLVLNTSSSKISDITFHDASHYSFTVTSEKAGKLPIFFSQSFDPYWILTSPSGIKTIDHTVGNSFGNLWEVYIPKRGSYTINAEYSLQKPYEYIVIASIISIVINIFAILYLALKSKDKVTKII